MTAETLEPYGYSNWPISSIPDPPAFKTRFKPPSVKKNEHYSTSRLATAICTLPRVSRVSKPSPRVSAAATLIPKPLQAQPNSPVESNETRFQANVGTTSKLPLPPVDPSKRLSSSPQTLQAPFNPRVRIEFHDSPKDVTMEGFPQQTPPHPSRSVPPHEQHPHPQHIQTTPLHQSRPTFTTPTRPLAAGPSPSFHTPGFQTPLQPPAWQVSPEAFQYHPPGIVVTPSMPTPHLAWNHTPQMQPYAGPLVDSPHSQLGGGFQHQIQDWSSAPPQQMPVQQQNFVQQSPVMVSPSNDGGFWNPPPLPTQNEPNPFVDEPPMMQPSTGVNPNLIFSFSSPIRPVPPMDPQFSSQTQPETTSRQPYEQQTRESLREKELARKARKDRPGLQRSNTDSGFRKSKGRSMDRSSLGQGLEHVPRRPSPLKRHSQISLTSIPETMRTSRTRTRLVIDETGTARTEIINGDDADSVDNRRSICQWSDTESSEDDPVISSQRNSYILSSEPGRPLKHHRLEDEFDAFASVKRPLSSTSLHSLGSQAHGAHEDHRRASYGSFLNQASSQETIMQDDDEEERGDAQDALRKLIGERIRKDPSDPNATIKPRRAVTNPVISTTMFDKFPSPSSPSPSLRAGSSTHTPLTDRSSRSNESTRCVCNNPSVDSSIPMIQCEVCAKWLHVRCVFGPQAEHAGLVHPGPYMCAFCTGQLQQHPQQIDAMPGTIFGGNPQYHHEEHNPFASPLGYKSGPFIG